MNSKTNQHRGWLALILLCPFLVFSPATLADLPGNPERDILWSAPNRELVLYFGGETARRTICPEFPNSVHQPFCRTFNAPVLEACGSPDVLQLVLSNGDVFRVNRALLGASGSFEPSHRPDTALKLIEAWMPVDTCNPLVELNHVVAMAANGQLWHFKGSRWRQVDE